MDTLVPFAYPIALVSIKAVFLLPLVATPPLAEQRRIVAKVDELMTLCDQLDETAPAVEAAE